MTTFVVSTYRRPWPWHSRIIMNTPMWTIIQLLKQKKPKIHVDYRKNKLKMEKNH